MATHEEAQFPELEGLKSSRSYAVHPACEKCRRLYPPTSLRAEDADPWWFATSCCIANLIHWRFLIGTRKGKINLTVRSRVAAVQKRGVWLCMVL